MGLPGVGRPVRVIRTAPVPAVPVEPEPVREPVETPDKEPVKV